MATRPPALLAAAVLLACGTPHAATRAASPVPGATDATVADSAARSTRAVEPAAPSRTQRTPAAALEGSWSLRTVEPRRGGPRLQLAIDSASDSTFRVRVAFLMQGDVGLDPTRFEPTRGSIAADGTVRLTIQIKGRPAPVARLAGTLAGTGDTIRLRRYESGGADLTAGGVHWLLVRER